MNDTRKPTPPQPLTAQSADSGSNLLSMLIAGLALITIGYAAIMIFV